MFRYSRRCPSRCCPRRRAKSAIIGMSPLKTGVDDRVVHGHHDGDRKIVANGDIVRRELFVYFSLCHLVESAYHSGSLHTPFHIYTICPYITPPLAAFNDIMLLTWRPWPRVSFFIRDWVFASRAPSCELNASARK